MQAAAVTCRENDPGVEVACAGVRTADSVDKCQPGTRLGRRLSRQEGEISAPYFELIVLLLGNAVAVDIREHVSSKSMTGRDPPLLQGPAQVHEDPRRILQQRAEYSPS